MTSAECTVLGGVEAGAFAAAAAAAAEALGLAMARVDLSDSGGRRSSEAPRREERKRLDLALAPRLPCLPSMRGCVGGAETDGAQQGGMPVPASVFVCGLWVWIGGSRADRRAARASGFPPQRNAPKGRGWMDGWESLRRAWPASTRRSDGTVFCLFVSTAMPGRMTRGDISCFPWYCRGGDTVMGDERFVRVFQYLPIVSGVFLS